MGQKRNAYMILVGKPKKPRLMWMNNIKMVLRDGVIWTALIWLGIGTSGGLL
jgi:hypothetical protein